MGNDTEVRPFEIASGWPRALIHLAVVLGFFFVLYWSTVWAIGRSWYEVRSFSHGFLILPIAGYSIWLRKGELLTLSPQPFVLAVLALVPMSVGWALSDFLSVQLGVYLAFYAQLCLLCWALLGHRAFLVLFLPLIYLSLALPIWNHLTPILQAQTATVSVALLRLIGVPVFNEGFYIQIPEGLFVVAEVCAGLRFFLATVAVAGFYLMLNLRSVGSAAVFLGTALLIAIVSNWIRVVGVIVAGHVTNMESPLVHGDGHIAFGWVMFLLGLGPVFFVGHRLQQVEMRREAAGKAVASNAANREAAKPGAEVRPVRATVLPVACVLCIALGPALTTWEVGGDAASRSILVLEPLEARERWTAAGPDAFVWSPEFRGPDASLRQNFVNEAGEPVGLYIALYATQHQGKELVNESNALFDKERWGMAEPPHRRRLVGPASPALVAQTLLARSPEKLMLWHWYSVDGTITESPLEAKLLPLGALLRARAPSSAVIAIATPYSVSEDEAVSRLTRFLEVMGSELAQVSVFSK